MSENKHKGVLISPGPPMECASAPIVPQKLGTGARLLTRLAHRWNHLTRGVTLGVRALVRDEAGRILLVRHGYVPGWHLPGGAVDTGETAEAAVIRELDEETGLRPIGRPRLHGVFLNLNLARRDHVLVYLIEGTRGDMRRPAGREIVEIGFFSLDALPDATTAPTRRRIAELVAGDPSGAHW